MANSPLPGEMSQRQEGQQSQVNQQQPWRNYDKKWNLCNPCCCQIGAVIWAAIYLNVYYTISAILYTMHLLLFVDNDSGISKFTVISSLLLSLLGIGSAIVVTFDTTRKSIISLKISDYDRILAFVMLSICYSLSIYYLSEKKSPMSKWTIGLTSLALIIIFVVHVYLILVLWTCIGQPIRRQAVKDLPGGYGQFPASPPPPQLYHQQ